MKQQISRRGFAAAAAALAGAPAAALAMEPVRRRGPSRMKLSLAAYSFRHYLTDHRRGSKPTASPPLTLESFVDLCAEYPLDGVEPTSY
jgi:hypothetical protein